MLDAVIARGRATAEEAHIRAAAHHLATFYLKARPEPLSGPAHRTLLESNVRHDLLELSHARYRLPRKRVALLADAQLTFLEACAALFERRIVSNRVVDGHGDLRPEHICVHPVPAIIDCLEFAKELRVLDPAAELAFLALECERLGDPQVGQWFLKTYTDVTGDRPPAPLLHFYRVQSALRRATIAAWHVDDPTVREPEWFRARARRYLELVEPVAIDPTCSS
jgi:aminoglycoside phosphotransferase family enzyme